MKIVQVMLAKGFGGAERSFVDISEALSAKGYEVVSIVESRGKAKSLLLSQQTYAIRVRSHWDPIAKMRIKTILKNEAPDLVHAHLARAAKIAGSAAKEIGIPSLVKTHNYVNLKYYRDVSCLVPTTRDQEKYLLSSGIPEQKISRIPNFTSLALIKEPDKRKILGVDIPHFVAIGRLVKKKGFDILLLALKDFAINNRFRLTIVGDGIERENLERLVRDQSLNGNVDFTGWSNDVRAILDTADIFVLPSLDEPFGIVVLEAMARGVPILSTTTQGPSEILDDTTAVLVEPGDVAAMLDGLRRVVEKPEQTLLRATKALSLCREKYSRDIVTEQYLALYRKLISAGERD